MYNFCVNSFWLYGTDFSIQPAPQASADSLVHNLFHPCTNFTASTPGCCSAFDQNSKHLNHSRVVDAIHGYIGVPLRVINDPEFPRHCVFVMQITRAVGTRKIEWEERALPQFQLLRRWILMNRNSLYYYCCRERWKAFNARNTVNKSPVQPAACGWNLLYGLELNF